jgi:hypothetical protein
MAFYAQLIADYFQARSADERTEATLADIVAHVRRTYQLPEPWEATLQDQARTRAQHRELRR